MTTFNSLLIKGKVKGATVKQEVTENVTFRMKDGRTMAMTNGIRMKTNEKGSFRTIYSRIFIPK